MNNFQDVGTLVLDYSYNESDRITLSKIENSEQPIIVNFTTDWCRDSQTLKENFRLLNQSSFEELNVIHINPEERINRDLVAKYNIRAVPTVLFVKHGELKDSFTGPLDLQTLKERINTFL